GRGVGHDNCSTHRRVPRRPGRGGPRAGDGNRGPVTSEMNMATPNHNLRIAVAGDDPEVRTYFQELLPRLGHQVVTAASGRQLVEQCRVLEPVLVIADIRLPDMDGIEAAQVINRQKETPIILVSGHHNAELLERAATGPIMAYLIKPVKQADVETAIRLARVRYEQFHALRQEAADLRQGREDAN